ncbi:MAG: class I SAM-dependent methyltransferase [Pacificimonas sp.]
MSGADNATQMADAFDDLVTQGVYSEGHVHDEVFRRLFADGLTEALSLTDAASPDILEVGCGAGAWLADMLPLLDESRQGAQLFGSDISPQMVETCRERFAGAITPERLFAGDILAESGYGGPDRRYDIIVAYDVVQQLPKAAQAQAFDEMVARLTDDGVLLIFDNEADSPFGRTMARKKFFTKYARLNLVPRYFCNARYPELALEAKRLAKAGFKTRLVQPNGLHKRYLIVKRQSS